MYFNKNPKPHHKIDRRHYTYNGKPKVSYNSRKEAEEILKKYPDTYKVYRCPICNKWHIGFVKQKNRGTKLFYNLIPLNSYEKK